MDVPDECYYCGSKGTLTFTTSELPPWYEKAGKSKILCYDYHCPVCGYEWAHWVKSGKNVRTFPINLKVPLKGRAA